MQISTKYDVAIIGAGIAGCSVATELSKRGHSVCVLEKNAGPGAKGSCTGIISGECLDLLAVNRNLIQFEARSAKVFSPSGKYIRVVRDNTQAYVLDRPSLDRTMAARAAESGASILYSALATSILTGPVNATVRATLDGQPLVFGSKVIVIASGAATSLVRDTGLGQIRELAQGAQCEVHCKDLDEVEVYSGTRVAPGFFAWLAPVGNGCAKAGLLCQGSARANIASFLGDLEKRGRIPAGRHEIKYGVVPLRPLSRTYGDRLIVVGDAAGQVKPTTGGGIYFAALCAGMAAGTIDEALRAGDLSARSLSAYQKRWHKLLKKELSIDYWAHRFYRGLDDKQIQHIFEVIERHGIHESLLESPDITFDWHGKVIFDALKHRSLQRSLEKLGMAPPQSFGR